MKNLREKMKNQGGFTLIEMLIVVAIIAILVAVSIPLVGSSLEQARMATDAANERAAKGEITIMYLNHQANPADTEYVKNTVYAYDAVTGKLLKTGTPSTKYGQCTTNSHSGKYLYVKYDEDTHTVFMKWDTTAPSDLTASDTNLCSLKVGATT